MEPLDHRELLKADCDPGDLDALLESTVEQLAEFFPAIQILAIADVGGQEIAMKAGRGLAAARVQIAEDFAAMHKHRVVLHVEEALGLISREEEGDDHQTT